MERIGFGKRLGAALIDVVLLIVLLFILISIFGAGYVGRLVQAVALLAYLSTEIVKGATPGKMTLGIVIRNADGSPASQDTLIKRYVIKYSGSLLNLVGAVLSLTGLFGILGGIAGLVIFVGCFFVLGESRQALHDTIPGTAVYPAAAPTVTAAA